MSVFSSVDSSGDPDGVIRYLDQTAIAAFRMKHYAMAAHVLGRPQGLVLDVGCGAGHDLDLLESAGLRGLGVDPSGCCFERRANEPVGQCRSFERGARRCRLRMARSPVVASNVCSSNVVDPTAVVTEIVRCLCAGALVTVFEPNWYGFTVRTSEGDEPCSWICNVRHPGLGSESWSLLEEAGCDVLDRVEELSIWRSLAVLDRVIGVTPSVDEAVVADRITRERADQWVTEQRERDARGVFRAAMPKILIVARKR